MKKKILEITQLTLGQFYLVDKYALSRSDKRVRELSKIEKAFKRAYKVDIDVVYIDNNDKSLIKGKNNNGYYHHLRKHIVIFVRNDFNATIKTLIHELTHAYQMKYMTDKMNESRRQLVNGEVSYRNAWHERHARSCSNILLDMDFSRDIKKIPAYKVA